MIIDQLPEIESVQSTDEMPVERGQTSYKTPISKIFASPTLTGTPEAPTAGVSTDNTQIATTAFANRAANNAVSTFVRPNLLNNWYFVGGGSQQGGGQFPINQRGQTIYNSIGYTIDRWKASNSVPKITVVESGIVFTGKTTDYGYVVQPLETTGLSGTMMLTLSVLADGVLYSSTFEYSSGGDVTLPNGLFIYMQANTPQVNFRTPLSTSDSAVIAAIKLELGSTQTLAHQENGQWVLNEIPDYGQELMKCQRYFITNLGENLVGRFSGPDFNFVIPTPVTMAKNPTVQVLTNGGIVSGNGAVIGFSSVSVTGTLLPNGVNLYCVLSNTSGGEIGIGSTYSLKLSFSADL